MAIRMLCPNGHELITEDAYAGRKVRCPHCQLLLVVPGAPPQSVRVAAPPPVVVPPAPLPGPAVGTDDELVEDLAPPDDVLDDLEDLDEPAPPRPESRERRLPRSEEDYEYEEEDDRPRKKKKATKKQQMAMVNLGLGFHYAKIICYLLAIIMVITGMILGGTLGAAAMTGGVNTEAGKSAGGAAAFFVIVMMLGLLVVVVVAPALGLIGSILCCWVPPKSQARVLIIVSLALDLSAFGLFFVMLIINAATIFQPRAQLGGEAVVVQVLQLLAATLSLAAWVLFMLFLRQFATYLDDDGSANEAMSITIKYGLGMLLGPPIVLGLGSVLVMAIPCLGALFFLVLLFSWMIFMAKQIMAMLDLIGSLRQKVRTRVGV